MHVGITTEQKMQVIHESCAALQLAPINCEPLIQRRWSESRMHPYAVIIV